jgi:hypothetical protein
LLPDQPPEAVHAVALVDDQARVVAVPLFTVLGVAARLTVGVAAFIDTVKDLVALAPDPVQVNT